ncbi:MAG: hypothetical protein RJB05_1189 [Armatimonadota bacterium]
MQVIPAGYDDHVRNKSILFVTASVMLAIPIMRVMQVYAD